MRDLPRDPPAAGLPPVMGHADPGRVPVVASLLVLALVALAVGADAFRIGFFADDFHFLDIARRLPLARTLGGQYGLWPWYRPLSRELYFAAVASAGPTALRFAHALSLVCLFRVGLLLARIGTRLVGRPAAWAGVVIFLSYGFTKFLAAWASGFQDLAAIVLIAYALDAYQCGRTGQALAWTALAPFAKETGFLVFPLLLLAGYTTDAGALAVHLLVRSGWHTGGAIIRDALTTQRLPATLLQILTEFVSRHPAPGPGSVALAVSAGVCAFALFAYAARRPQPDAHELAAPPPGGVAFVAGAAALGLLPLGVAPLLGLTLTQAYYAYPAVPWLALGLGVLVTRLPAPLWRTGLAALVAWNVLGTGVHAVDLDRPQAWRFHRWSWDEAVRLSAVTGRLTSDLRATLAHRPDSLVVLYEGVPRGCFFQTEDGPASREALADPGVRAYWVNRPPRDVDADRLAIVGFDAGRFHLVRERWSSLTAVRRAMEAAIAGRGRAANALALYTEAPDSAGFDRGYLRAAAALLDDGPEGFLEGLADLGLDDTLGWKPGALAAPIAVVDAPLGAALAEALRQPLTASAHAALADSLLARGVVPRLAQVMAALGGEEEAADELAALGKERHAGPVAAEARRVLKALRRAREGTPR
ncbi:MAG: hypothetical protein E6K81_12545 [Candidatus Eisenbacteria bacterium]|uniref:Glycosyltransferase RgtA/B/C/D-like domain-containing protein n=1 Tax=Eiseniibacteriota bacterium TaxID=2212470 RepID=A0A538U3J6_UNCEI|nr:MAG: hypothetical protein E6K81_12545 [Candidatus Eisenbacteria bacterium]